MALSGKLIGHLEITKGGDFFHEILMQKPHEMVAMLPGRVHDCELHEGERGAVGSVICWHYTQDGKKKILKELIESVDEEKHRIVYKVVGGEIAETYKSFTIVFHVEPKGDKQVITLTFEFEKPDTSTPYPTAFMEYVCTLFKDMDEHK